MLAAAGLLSTGESGTTATLIATRFTFQRAEMGRVHLDAGVWGHEARSNIAARLATAAGLLRVAATRYPVAAQSGIDVVNLLTHMQQLLNTCLSQAVNPDEETRFMS